MVLFAQAEAAGRVATTAGERLLEYGGLGAVVVILFLMVFGGLYLFGYYLMPALIVKWNTDLQWYQAELQRKSDAHAEAFKEQSRAFVAALAESQARFTADLAAIRTDHREEVNTVVGISREQFASVHSKLDQILAAVEGRKHESPRRG